MTKNRVQVKKNYKVLINNNLVRSESNRTYKVMSKDGKFLANVVRSSKEDLRDAVRYARNVLESWFSRSGYNKGQIIYKMAEELENRKQEFVNELELMGVSEPLKEVEVSIDRLVYFAGFADKFHHLIGTVNNVNSKFVNYSTPEPVGVVGVVLPEKPNFLGFISLVIPIIMLGNVAVVLIENNPLSVLSFSEVIIASDMLPGVINILTGFYDELVPVLANHMDVNGICFVYNELNENNKKLKEIIQEGASNNIKRTFIKEIKENDFYNDEFFKLEFLMNFVEIKTIWIPQMI
ncbi:MAG: aldehyde dehydrogenase family protein [bacterium]|jgi:acyl-CoA reductase-like NAD-dependent aldehyde dehydrogenase